MVLLDLIGLPEHLDGGVATVMPHKEQGKAAGDVWLVSIGLDGGAKIGLGVLCPTEKVVCLGSVVTQSGPVLLPPALGYPPRQRRDRLFEHCPVDRLVGLPRPSL